MANRSSRTQRNAAVVTAAAADFLGRGWSFPPAFGPGGIAMSSEDRKIAESIRIILGTARGERVMRPEFGCGIHELVFEMPNESTLALIRVAVREALILWEPRIEVLGVGVQTSDAVTATVGVLTISVDYRIRSTNNEFNLVYPFYLREGA